MKISGITTGTDHEQVMTAEDPALGYRGIIAIHSTRLGPAVGGTRVWHYNTFDHALQDVLRLSRGMTFKNAAAGLPLGGGKSVIMVNGMLPDRRDLFRAHGQFVESFGGRYITAEDAGSSPADMAFVREATTHVAGLAELSGDPSPVTAHGVFRAMQATLMHLHGTTSLAGKRVAVQGVGHVGYHLAEELYRAGAHLVLADIDESAVSRCVSRLGATRASPEDIHRQIVDIFAPCALGGTINARTIPELGCAVIAGAANNQLGDANDASLLAERGIAYAPDYIANAGGVINGSREILGWTAEYAAEKVEGIFDTMLQVFQSASRESITTAEAADRLAMVMLARGA
ncbi:MAG: Glu/Leu/Phe/Val dehydrogenase dimerization domain-containing protein [Gemmatimonadota bacterium]